MKKIFTIILKTILGLFAFIALYLFTAFCLSSITIHQEPDTKQEVTIYILTNGVHTDLVVPVTNEIYDWSQNVRFENTLSKNKAYNHLAMGWGDKGFYLETPEWKDLKASVAFKAAFALSTTAIHATYYETMKSPRAAAHPTQKIIGDSIWQLKKAGDSLRTKNEHMKSPRARAHPAPMIIWGFHVTIKK